MGSQAEQPPRINNSPEVSVELEQRRLLTEVNNLRASKLRNGGVVSHQDAQDVLANLETATYEIAMPYAVSSTFQRIEYESDEQGRRQRIITWLGKNAVEVAINGKLHHVSQAAHDRVDIEAAEACHAQNYLRPGYAQAFISPKMSAKDAPVETAKQENLHDDDSLRVSYAVTNREGEVIGRRLESLLVRDIPLTAWIAMLKDPNNIFGQAYPIGDEESALSVMQLFRNMELPEDKINDGPVALVAEVASYVHDPEQHNSIISQLQEFKKDQTRYKEQAKKTAQEWYEFEEALADSLDLEKATSSVRQVIVSLQHNWNDDDLGVINDHSLGDAEYRMSEELAAILERAKRNVLTARAGIATGNKDMISQAAKSGDTSLRTDIQALEILRSAQTVSEQEYALRQAQLERRIASVNIKGGGGCPGDVAAKFRNKNEIDPHGNQPEQIEDSGQSSDWENGNRTWKKGNCQVKACTSPKPTEVGPCSVCKNCQRVFDKGGDPTKLPAPSAVPENKAGSAMWRLLERSQEKARQAALKNRAETNTKTTDRHKAIQRVGELTLAA